MKTIAKTVYFFNFNVISNKENLQKCSRLKIKEIWLVNVLSDHKLDLDLQEKKYGVNDIIGSIDQTEI